MLFRSDWDRLDELLLAQGVTTWCPTLVTMPLPRYEAPLARIAEAMNRPSPGRPTIAGVHLEGPFLGRAPGAHPTERIVAPDMGWLARLPAHVTMMTIAPEQPGAIEAIRMLEDGVASAEDIDRASVLAFHHPIGPLRLTDMVGLDVRLDIARVLEASYGERYRPPALLIEMVEKGLLGRKSGRGFFEWPEVS